MSTDPRSDIPSPCSEDPVTAGSLSRRDFLTGTGIAGIAAASTPMALPAGEPPEPPDGTPEQIHLTWGEDPCTMVCVSWACPAQAANPRVEFGAGSAGTRTVHAVQRIYTDGINGLTVFTYHARLDALAPGTKFRYAVTADNDRQRGTPFTGEFTTAPRGRAAFRWTSYGDLATPVTRWSHSSEQSRHAVQAVERFQPLFHLLNGDLCYANVNPTSQPQVWADFGRNVQASASRRPWMPCPGNHEIEFHNGAQGMDAYLTRYSLPANGTAFPGRWYSFRVGTAVFVSLSADDVIYQDCGPFIIGPSPLRPAPSTGNAPIEPGTSLQVYGYSGGAQTRWLEQTLAGAASDPDVDWIIVQMHQDALSSSRTGNGSDRGLREAWLPLFDRYGVDLVLCGHDHDYERSWPVRGCNHDVGRDARTGATVDTWQPRPTTTQEPADGRFDTSHGTIHLILGGGGTSLPCDVYGAAADTGRPQAKVFTRRNPPQPTGVPGTFMRVGADAIEEAVWSARRDAGTGYGIAVFDLDPDMPDAHTSITIRYYHAPGADRTPTPDYELFETVVVRKKRRK